MFVKEFDWVWVGKVLVVLDFLCYGLEFFLVNKCNDVGVWKSVV